MGYTTDFVGKMNITPQIDLASKKLINNLNKTRRMKRDLTLIMSKICAEDHGIEGEFYFGDDKESILDHNTPPSSQPGLNCGWMCEDSSLLWDGIEKFYNYFEWMEYIFEILQFNGYQLHGEIKWRGEDIKDCGTITAYGNYIRQVEDISQRQKKYT